MTENAIVPAAAAKEPMVRASGRVVAASLDQIWSLAEGYHSAGMLPAGIKNPAQMYIALLAGYEAGMPLTLAAKSVMVVNNRPTIWGDGAVGLVRASGLCRFIQERIDGEGDNRVAVCRTQRKGEDEPTERRFGVADAKKASLWGKAGPWQQYPERMLAARARSFLLRDVYADVLGGLHIREEVEDFSVSGGGSPRHAAKSESADLVDALPVDEPPRLPAPDEPSQDEPNPDGAAVPPSDASTVPAYEASFRAIAAVANVPDIDQLLGRVKLRHKVVTDERVRRKVLDALAHGALLPTGEIAP